MILVREGCTDSPDHLDTYVRRCTYGPLGHDTSEREVQTVLLIMILKRESGRNSPPYNVTCGREVEIVLLIMMLVQNCLE